MEDIEWEEANSSRILKNIHRDTRAYLRKAYPGCNHKELASSVLRRQGLTPELALDPAAQYDRVHRAKMKQDISIDDNSNKENIDINGVWGEVHDGGKKLKGFEDLYRSMLELYGKDRAKTLSARMYTYDIGISDSTSLHIPYCWSADASSLLTVGRPWGQLPSGPSKHPASYVHALTDTIHEMSNHLAGAIAIGTFILDITFILKHHRKMSLADLCTDPVKRKEVGNVFQMFVHSVNHLSRGSVQSPFTNLSMFDGPKLEALIDDTKNNYSEILLDEDFNEIPGAAAEFAEFARELQWIFMEFFDLGDPINGGRPYRFPVATVNTSKKIPSLESYFGTEWWERLCKNSDINPDKPVRLEKVDKVETLFINDWPVTEDTKVKMYANLADIRRATLIEKFESHIRETGRIEVEDWLVDEVVEDRAFFDRFSEAQVDRYNIFASKAKKLAMCCRFMNDMELIELGAEVNSFGGSSVAMGSHRVATLGLNRFALQAQSIEEFYEFLQDAIDDTAAILSAHKRMLLADVELGYHKFVHHGWINIKKMFSTFGIMGIVEASRNLERFTGPGVDNTKEILQFINGMIPAVSQKYGIIGNVEQIPGESFAIRLADVDREMFGADKVPEQLYSNQFVPLWEPADIWTRLREDGRYNSYYTGGGIAHAQIGEKTTPEQNRAIMVYSILVGCEHFALNSVYSICENNHSTFGKNTTCPDCGAAITDTMSRVVGFFVKQSAMNKTRRDFEFPARPFSSLCDSAFH